jgi:RNA recognition motif-containing protein
LLVVLSRTLFVGGVTSSESHLRSLFAAYGIVQTCIVNVDKRHAFVKMIDRADAVKARDGMEQYKSGDMQLRVGFLFSAFLLMSSANLILYRLVGALASGPATAATTRPGSVSFPSRDSLMPIASGC